MKDLVSQISSGLDDLDSSFIDNFSCYFVGWSGLIGNQAGRSEMGRYSSRLIKRLNATGDAHE